LFLILLLGCESEISEPTDCAGNASGHAELDNCNVCDTDKTNDCIPDCAGEWGGDNSTCLDCAGVIDGTAVADACDVCGGDNSTCDTDCAGTPNGDSELDDCGVCGGDNSSCSDCAGIPNGDAELDVCGICNGNGAFDMCGTCDAAASNDCVQDCAGEWGGTAVADACDVCGGDNSTCADCAGVTNGDAKVDCGTYECTTDFENVELWGECYNIEETTDISFNTQGLTGEIPKEIGSLINLTTLYLMNNTLTSIPSEIGNLTNLTKLFLHNNEITEIPNEICINYQSFSEAFSIFGNSICGELPSCLDGGDIGDQDCPE